MSIKISYSTEISYTMDPLGQGYEIKTPQMKIESSRGTLTIFRRLESFKFEYAQYGFKATRLASNEEGAHKIIDDLSRGYFNSYSLEEATNKFIKTACAVKTMQMFDTELAQRIRDDLGHQEGAMNLLNDLESKPFNQEIKYILLRLHFGSYGNSKTMTALFLDLQRIKCFDLVNNLATGRYIHEVPVKSKL